MQKTVSQSKITKLQSKINKKSEVWINEMYKICESLDYKNSSRFSYNVDRLKQFVQELNDFEIVNEPKKICYVEYLNSKNNFQKTRKDFYSYEDAMRFLLTEFEKPNSDFIKFY